MQLDTYKLERTRAALGVDVAIFADFYNVSYLTGYTAFFENGPSPFTRGTAAAIFTAEQVVLVAEGPGDPAEAGGWSGVPVHYVGYAYQAGPHPVTNFVNALARAADVLPQSGRIGVEKGYLPVSAWERLQDLRPNVEWVDLPPALMLDVRAIKGPAEMERIRACARLAEVGQNAIREAVQQPGKTEIEVYNHAKRVMEQHAGGRFALQNALHGGPNADSPFPGMPTDYALKPGDLIISDMVPYLEGYWGDTCSTFVVGGEAAINEQARQMHAISRDAFMRGFEAARPGVTGGELDALVRGYVRDQGYEYPHHTGHGIGVSNHEEPRIIIDSQTVLEPGMVVVLEPAVYVPGVGGVRQERMFVITDDGADLLSHNAFELG